MRRNGISATSEVPERTRFSKGGSRKRLELWSSSRINQAFFERFKKPKRTTRSRYMRDEVSGRRRSDMRINNLHSGVL